MKPSSRIKKIPLQKKNKFNKTNSQVQVTQVQVLEKLPEIDKMRETFLIKNK